MKIIAVFLLTCLLGEQAFSQRGYQPGFIIDLQGDTVRGQIYFRKWDKNPLKISFRKESASFDREYVPGDIVSFFVAGEFYETADVMVDTSAYKVEALSNFPEPEYGKDRVFLQSLVGGEKRLLFLKDQVGKSHFYIVEDGEYKPLVYKQYVQEINDPLLLGYKKGLFENTGYKTQLALYLNQCGDIQRKMTLLKYEGNSLQKLFSNYYDCIMQKASYHYTRNETAIALGIQAGATSTNFRLSNSTWTRFRQFNSSVDPSFGLFFDLKFSRTRGFSVANDFFYNSFETNGEGYVPGSGTFDVAVSSFSVQVIRSNHQVRLELFNHSGLYAGGGLALARAQVDWQTEVYKSSEPTVSSQQDSHLFAGFVATLGYRFRKVSGEIKYDQISNQSGYEISGVHVFIKYRLIP